jgi:circadian clock protein KaiC
VIPADALDAPDAPDLPRVETGIAALDAILAGGLPRCSVTVLAGPPGAGKTILAQEILFRQPDESRGLYFNALSEPTAKTLLYAAQLGFFDAAKVGTVVEFVDLGDVARTGGLEEAIAGIAGHVERVRPSIVVVDGFRVFDELAPSRDALRRFGYELAVKLMVWECTALLLGEYGAGEMEVNPLFSVVDGLAVLRQEPTAAGEPRRVIEVVKMRGTGHSRRAHPFTITRAGIAIGEPGP